MEQDLYLERFLTESTKLGSKHAGGREGLISAWEYLQDVDQITPAHIINVHSLITGQELEEGDFREEPAYMGDIVFADPYHMVNAKIKSWCRAANVPISKKLHDPAKIKCLVYRHIQFEKIHPFLKANGQVGRLLFLWAAEKYHLPIWEFNGDQKQEYNRIFINYNNEDEDRVGINHKKFMTEVCENPCAN